MPRKGTALSDEAKARNDAAIKACRDIYMKKLTDYGPSWRILRASSLTDQIFIKANRIRNLQIKKVSKVF